MPDINMKFFITTYHNSQTREVKRDEAVQFILRVVGNRKLPPVQIQKRCIMAVDKPIINPKTYDMLEVRRVVQS